MARTPAPAPPARMAWGILLLAGFEILLVGYTASFGVSEFTLSAAGAAVLLLVAWWQVRGGAMPHALVFAGVALLTLHRAVAQTLGPFRWGIVVTYLVPLGFLLLATPGRDRAAAALAGIALVALARSWFAVWYLAQGGAVLAAANVVGAAGAWLWAWALLERARA